MTKRLEPEQKNLNRLVRAIKTDIRRLYRAGVWFDANMPANEYEVYGKYTATMDNKTCGVCAIGAVAVNRCGTVKGDQVADVSKLFDVPEDLVYGIFQGVMDTDRELKNAAKYVDEDSPNVYLAALDIKRYARKNGFDKRPKKLASSSCNS